MDNILAAENLVGQITTRLQLSPEQERDLAKIANHSFDQIRWRILKDEALLAEVADEAITEFRKFLTLIYLGYRGLGMTSKQVDEVWHTAILFTEDYMAFCQDVFGFYLHHRPNTELTPVPSSAGPKFREAYLAVFGGPIPDIWGFENSQCAESLCKVSECQNCSGTTNCQDPE
jgi:hypothetical protein